MKLSPGSLRASIGSLAFGLTLAFSGLATTSCASGGDKDKGDDLADDDKPKKKKKKKKKKAAKPDADADKAAGDQ